MFYLLSISQIICACIGRCSGRQKWVHSKQAHELVGISRYILTLRKLGKRRLNGNWNVINWQNLPPLQEVYVRFTASRYPRSRKYESYREKTLHRLVIETTAIKERIKGEKKKKTTQKIKGPLDDLEEALTSGHEARDIGSNQNVFAIDCPRFPNGKSNRKEGSPNWTSRRCCQEWRNAFNTVCQKEQPFSKKDRKGETKQRKEETPLLRSCHSQDTRRMLRGDKRKFLRRFNSGIFFFLLGHL